MCTIRVVCSLKSSTPSVRYGSGAQTEKGATISELCFVSSRKRGYFGMLTFMSAILTQF